MLYLELEDLKITTDNSTYNKGADAYVTSHSGLDEWFIQYYSEEAIQFLFDVTRYNNMLKLQFATEASSDPTNSCYCWKHNIIMEQVLVLLD
jgi:hypothetical protein